MNEKVIFSNCLSFKKIVNFLLQGLKLLSDEEVLICFRSDVFISVAIDHLE